ncbi:uncharacterized protein V1516DRAFT_673625 [Lipomyces oligophaga]|uniref:uncharacterized protein n=1 Tax=Lipomyces oligophaga TaxID=45792 RepID=UPI0034CE43F7
MYSNEEQLDRKLPLNGLVLCSTGLSADEQREIEHKCHLMGGKFCEDLVGSVTHIVLDRPTTEKYNYVVLYRPDIVFLNRRFVPQLYEKWISGDDVNVEVDIVTYGEYRMFSGYTISVTNVTDPERSKWINFIQKHGGVYSSGVDVSTSILVAWKPEGPKFEFTQRRKMLSVDSSWLLACKRRGAFVPPSDFSYALTSDERASNFRKVPSKNTKMELQKETSSIPKDHSPAPMIRRSTKSKGGSTWQSLMQEATSAEGESIEVSPFEIVSATEVDSALKTRKESPNSKDAPEELILKGYVLWFKGYDSSKIIRIDPYLSSRGAKVVSTLDGDITPTHVVVEYKERPENLPKITAATTLITDWFLDLAIYHKQVVSPVESRYASYLGYDIYSPEAHIFKDLTISLSCFQGMERVHVQRLIPLLGASVNIGLDSQDDLLVLPSTVYDRVQKETGGSLPGITSTAKIQHARLWGIPIIPDKWILDRKYYKKIGKLVSAAKLRRQKRTAHNNKENDDKPRRTRQRVK